MLHEILSTIHERSNPYDCYAIAARKSLPGTLAVESTVGHLPKEISRLTSFIMLHGAIVVVKILNTHHRRSPLVQGGLENYSYPSDSENGLRLCTILSLSNATKSLE